MPIEIWFVRKFNYDTDSDSPSRNDLVIWNRDRLYEIMDFGTYMYVLVCTEYIPVRNAENGTYWYVPVCTEFKFVQVLWHASASVWLPWSLALF